MKEEIYSFCKNVLHVTDETLIDEFYHFSMLTEVKRGKHIIEAGKEQQNIPFLVKGIARGYFLEDEREVTDCIVAGAGEALIGFMRLDTEKMIQIAEFSVIALTDCVLICTPMGIINKMVTTNSEAAMVYIRLLEQSLEQHSAVKKMLYIRKPEERYKWFCETYPELVQLLKEKKIKQKDVASYLNMAEQTFSNILKSHRE